MRKARFGKIKSNEPRKKGKIAQCLNGYNQAMYNFGVRGWAALHIENYAMFRQTLQLINSCLKLKMAAAI
jgi:hypothetical protein